MRNAFTGGGLSLVLMALCTAVAANPYPEDSCEHLVSESVRHAPNMSRSDRVALTIEVNRDALEQRYGSKTVNRCKQTLMTDNAQAESCITHYQSLFVKDLPSDFEEFLDEHGAELRRDYPRKNAQAICLRELKTLHMVFSAF